MPIFKTLHCWHFKDVFSPPDAQRYKHSTGLPKVAGRALTIKQLFNFYYNHLITNEK